MKTYTAIALMSLSGLFLSATCALSIESPVEQLETSTAQYMLSAQTQQKGERPLKRNSPRRNFTEPTVYTHPLQ